MAVMPPPLRPGSLVAIVAPAGPFDREELMRGLAWLRTRYRLRVASSIFARGGYLAGDDARRAEELGRAMTDPEVEAIVCARGGYGAMRVLDALPWDAFAARPKWIAGFSDITALHVEAGARGICSLHAPVVTGLGRVPSPAERAAWIAGLERAAAPVAWKGLDVLAPGDAEGVVCGGNLAIVEAMAAAGRRVVPDDGVVLLEDVGERPYRVDRMLTALRLGGHFARARAVVFGSFSACDPGPDGVRVDDVLARFAASLPAGVPVLRGAPFGHAPPNHAFVLARRARVTGDALAFE